MMEDFEVGLYVGAAVLLIALAIHHFWPNAAQI